MNRGYTLLSYQHGYHAGVFADVIKHLVLSRILTYVTQKDKPLLYLDTHAGCGLYDLQGKKAMKNQEFSNGISEIWLKRQHLSPEFSPFLSALEHWNADGHLRYYPGSPALAIHLLRKQDRLFLCEKHPSEYEHLHSFSRRYPRVHCAHSDGYERLVACLPPPEQRGVIMIDPSYEIKDEYALVPQKVQMAIRKFSQGIYCIWYPIIDNMLPKKLLQGLAALPVSRSLRVEFQLNSQPPLGMDGCGLYIINQPFTLEHELRVICDELLKIFNPGRSSYTLQTVGR